MPQIMPQIHLADLSNTQLEQIIATQSADPRQPTSFALPQDFSSPYIDVLAREQYARAIQRSGGAVHPSGRVQTWPRRQRDWTTVLQYVATLVDPARTHTQEEVLRVITYAMPGKEAVGRKGFDGTPDACSMLRSLVDMGILEREADGMRVWRTMDRGYPMALDDPRQIKPRF
ncbi:hypothetical protein BC830DRAFT_1082910 [Chytriomyces sp. MP71]|nr:hypothetical protein BC830DRAFT_1082910 [Chytriomyces sp. MP71]